MQRRAGKGIVMRAVIPCMLLACSGLAAHQACSLSPGPARLQLRGAGEDLKAADEAAVVFTDGARVVVPPKGRVLDELNGTARAPSDRDKARALKELKMIAAQLHMAEEMAVVEGKAPRASKRKTAVTVAGVASSAHDVGCVPLPFGPFWGPLLVATGNTYVGLISVAGRLLSRLRDLILVCAVDICMRYRLVERAPKGMRATLVKLWRYGCELGSICSEALHEVLLFRQRGEQHLGSNSWSHDAEYSMWHATHHHVWGLGDWREDVEAESDGSGNHTHDQTINQATQFEHNPPDIANGVCGDQQILRLNAKLLAHNVNVATATSLAQAVQDQLQDKGGISEAFVRAELEQAVDHLFASLLSKKDSITSPAQVRSAIRHCRCSYPGSYTISIIGHQGSGKTTCAVKLAQWIQTGVTARGHASISSQMGDDLTVAVATLDVSAEAEAELSRLAAAGEVTVITRSTCGLEQSAPLTTFLAAARSEASRRSIDVLVFDAGLGVSKGDADFTLVVQALAEDTDLLVLVADLLEGHDVADGILSLQSTFDSALDERCENQVEEEWTHVKVSLPDEAADDLLGKSSHLLRSAMRETGLIITLQRPKSSLSAGKLSLQHEQATVMTIEGSRDRIELAHKYFGQWSSLSQEQIACQLALAKANVRPQEPTFGRSRQRHHCAVICTKADLVGKALGGMINVASSARLPILWVSNGQVSSRLQPVPSARTMVDCLLS